MNKFYCKRKIIFFPVSLAICIGLMIWSMKLYNADLHIPFNYMGDALYYYSITKTVIEEGWVWQNGALGAPYGLENYDYPGFNILDVIIIKIISIFSSDSIFVENLFYLLTFPLTTLTSIIVFRQFKINYAYSLLGGLLFTYIPCHFLRGVSHLNVSSYYIIPLMVMVLLWIYRDEFVLHNSDNIFQIKCVYSDRKIVSSIIICILSGISFLYYTYIFCLFLLLLGCLMSTKLRRKSSILISIMFVALVISIIIVSFSPILIYDYQNGSNKEVASRHPAETEIYGMKIIQLLLPINGHRIPIFSKIARYYDSTAPLVNENSCASLGIIASLGFIILITYIFFMSYGAGIKLNFGSSDLYRLGLNLEGLSILNLSAVLFATIGGFSSMVAYSISPQFRAINRMSIFIAFFSIFAILIILEYISNIASYRYNIRSDKLIYLVACTLLIVGMLDQTSESLIPSYTSIKEEWSIDEKFINAIEEKMPENAMIFQLPYASYPQNPPVNKMTEFSHIRAYLHSNNLRWSYGATTGRAGGCWQNAIVSLPLEDMIRVISLEGFQGIYVDSFGYPDQGIALILNLTKTLKTYPVNSNDKRLYFFDLRKYDKEATSINPKRNSVATAFYSGFYDPEIWFGITTRWTQSDAALLVYSPDNRTANLTLRAQSFYRPRTMEVYLGEDRAASVAVPSTGFVNATIVIRLMKGANIVRLHVPEGCERPCDINELNNPDSRCLSIALQNVTVT